jgi:hypothetical protein
MKNIRVTAQNLAPTLLPIETIAGLRNWKSQNERSNIAKIPLAKSACFLQVSSLSDLYLQSSR